MDTPPLERGVVVVHDDRISAVEAAGGRTPDIDFGNAALMPGLVNAHTHLDLGGLRGLAPPSPDFIGWLRQVIAHRRSRSPEQIQADIAAGVAECLRFGTTLVGDVDGGGNSWRTLATAPLRAVVFREVLGLPTERAAKAWADAEAWLTARPPTSTCRPGISPHAPYSVRSSLFQAASTRGVPVAIHLAETAAELELLAQRRGAFVPFLRDLGVWDPTGLVEGLERLISLFDGRSPTLFVHANYLVPTAPIPRNGTVVYCPRTHAAFGHPPHPLPHFLQTGTRVALGTDSLASNPDLDLLAEVRFAAERHPNVPGSDFLRMATLSGAEALGWQEQTGSLTPGKSADLVVVALPDSEDADPYRLVLDAETHVQIVVCRGRMVYDNAAAQEISAVRSEGGRPA
jgi:cytosine/adenosine deaminase-related metal-dependent hydrolase